jgi:hypothetical protein
MAKIAAMIRSDGMRKPQMNAPIGALLTERQIMSPKHTFFGMRIRVDSQVMIVSRKVVRMHVGVFHLDLGEKGMVLSDLKVISIPNVR